MTSVDPVLMPMMRRILPNILAQQIIGVQPMTYPAGNIFGLRENYDINYKIQTTPELYNTFVRIYNRRRKYVKVREFIQAGYPSVYADMQQGWHNIHDWCRANFGPYGYVWFGDRFFFENEDHKNMFVYAGWARQT